MPRCGMPRTVEVAVIGAGQAGLVMSQLLRAADREHVLLERRTTLGGSWQDRWDAFRLVSPNWMVSMPGLDYQGTDPDGYMGRDALIDHWRQYAVAIHAPVELGTDVTRVSRYNGVGSARFALETSSGTIRAQTVVVAAGPFQRKHVPDLATQFGPSLLSLHAHDYRTPDALPPGGVLLIGSGQTGVQLAEELVAAGRSVTLAVGRCGHAPRRYRGRDIFWWLRQLGTVGREIGTPLPTADRLPSPAARFACNPQLSGHGGGHDIRLRRMAAQGVRLVGRMVAVDGTVVQFAEDLAENLVYADRFFDERLRPLFDAYVERVGDTFPDHEPEQFAFEVPHVPRLDLGAEGISTVIWTSGYRPDFGWIDSPAFDPFGLPLQTRGRSEETGLAFIGTPWLLDMGSANLVGLLRDAEALVADLP